MLITFTGRRRRCSILSTRTGGGGYRRSRPSMSKSMPAAKIGNPQRWKSWARSLARRGLAGTRRVAGAMTFLRPRWNLNIAAHWHSNHVTLRPLLQFAFGPFSVAPIRQTISTSAESLHSVATSLSPERSRLHISRPSVIDPRRTLIRAQFMGWPGAIVPGASHAGDKQTLAGRVIGGVRRVEQRISARTFVVAGGKPSPIPAVTVDSRMERPGPSGTAWAWGSGHERPAPPAVNVDQITENVLRRLDRRVSAWRERTGRS